jgi:hypothetical protein
VTVNNCMLLLAQHDLPSEESARAAWGSTTAEGFVEFSKMRPVFRTRAFLCSTCSIPHTAGPGG